MGAVPAPGLRCPEAVLAMGERACGTSTQEPVPEMVRPSSFASRVFHIRVFSQKAQGEGPGWTLFSACHHPQGHHGASLRLLGGLHSPQMDRLSSLGYVGSCQEGSASVSPGAVCSVLLEEYVQGLETPLLVLSCPPPTFPTPSVSISGLTERECGKHRWGSSMLGRVPFTLTVGWQCLSPELQR